MATVLAFSSSPIRVRRVTAVPGDATAAVGRDAVRALYAEVALHPKPGLVSPVDSGSHTDMDMATFIRSLSALRPYFGDIAAAGAAGGDFTILKTLGIDAEKRMLKATGGVNTHRGAVFGLGLLAAAAGYRAGVGHGDPRNPSDPRTLGEIVAARWGADILAAAPPVPQSHGAAALARHGGRGARQEAAAGFPTLYTLALPALRDVLAATGDTERAMAQTLFVLMAAMDDTNVLHRGGADGLAFLQREAGAFLARGGVLQADWRAQALRLHRDCVARRLSPGGAADMLAATWFVHLRNGSY
jgi:triphosphoribosyl-dephospho-CoA synthase